MVLILYTLPLEAALLTSVWALVVNAKVALLPRMSVTLTILGFAMIFPYPNTIDMAMALPVEAGSTPLLKVKPPVTATF